MRWNDLLHMVKTQARKAHVKTTNKTGRDQQRLGFYEVEILSSLHTDTQKTAFYGDFFNRQIRVNIAHANHRPTKNNGCSNSSERQLFNSVLFQWNLLRVGSIRTIFNNMGLWLSILPRLHRGIPSDKQQQTKKARATEDSEDLKSFIKPLITSLASELEYSSLTPTDNSALWDAMCLYADKTCVQYDEGTHSGTCFKIGFTYPAVST